MVDKNIIQSRFTKLGVVPIDNQHYLYATLDNNLIGIITVIKTCDNHYYEENEIEVGKPMDCQVVVNHVVKLTAEEKAEARQNAVRKYQEEELRKLQNRHRPSARKENQPQPSLFDLGL